MIGYKAFDDRLCCRGYQFEVGKTYETGFEKCQLRLCSHTVFHFCRELNKIEIMSSYTLSRSRVCEVIAEGDIINEGYKYGTNKIHILREIPKEELDKYINSYNTGFGNSGDYNTGNYNTGDCNAGNWNTGYYNTGSYNTGSWNSGEFNIGFFNTDMSPVRMFNKETTIPFADIKFPSFLQKVKPVIYIDITKDKEYSEEDRKNNKSTIDTFKGFLKKIDFKEAFRRAWDNASKEEHKELLKLPNWDNKVFKEISGIDAEKEISDEENLADEEG